MKQYYCYNKSKHLELNLFLPAEVWCKHIMVCNKQTNLKCEGKSLIFCNILKNHDRYEGQVAHAAHSKHAITYILGISQAVQLTETLVACHLAVT